MLQNVFDLQWPLMNVFVSQLWICPLRVVSLTEERTARNAYPSNLQPKKTELVRQFLSSYNHLSLHFISYPFTSCHLFSSHLISSPCIIRHLVRIATTHLHLISSHLTSNDIISFPFIHAGQAMGSEFAPHCRTLYPRC